MVGLLSLTLPVNCNSVSRDIFLIDLQSVVVDRLRNYPEYLPVSLVIEVKEVEVFPGESHGVSAVATSGAYCDGGELQGNFVL